MRAGKLDQTIVIERASVAVNGDGAAVETWSPLVTLRAETVLQSADETQGTEGTSTAVSTTFRTRFYPGITVADRLIHDGRAHNIVAVTEIGRRRELELKATARGLG